MRGQAAFELLFVLVIALLLLFWLGNYSSQFEKTSYAAAVSSQQRLAAKQFAGAVNDVCVRAVNYTFQTACLKWKAADAYYTVSAAVGTADFYLYNSFSNSTEKSTAVCLFGTTFNQSIKCSETPQLCIQNIGGKISVVSGGC